jgi:hypothetical protein
LLISGSLPFDKASHHTRFIYYPTSVLNLAVSNGLSRALRQLPPAAAAKVALQRD